MTNKRLLLLTFIFLLLLNKNASADPLEYSAGSGKILECKTKNKTAHEIMVDGIKSNYSDKELEMLQKIAIAEAKCDGIDGMSYVVRVILNRVRSERFPDSIEKVITQNGQFSTVRNGSYARSIPDKDSFEACFKAILFLDDNDALFFENDNGKKSTWHSRNLEYLFEYKHHKFYK